MVGDFNGSVEKKAQEIVYKREKEIIRKYKTMYEKDKRELEKAL